MRAPRCAALGDSPAEGVGDRAGGARRGRAALLAEPLGPEPARFTDLAVSGAQTRDVIEGRPPAAPALRPALVSAVVGVDDTLRRTFGIRAVAARFDQVYAACTGRGAGLLTACPPDPGTVLGLPGEPARRQRAVNSVGHALSDRYGAVHLHACEGGRTTDRAMWSADRLHPGEPGHRQPALRFHALPAARGIATARRAVARAGVPGAHPDGEPVVAGHGRRRPRCPGEQRPDAA